VPTSSIEILRQLEEKALVCVRCGLAETRTQVVFGVGDPSARLMLVGEAPGKNEDLQGEPFVGAAGKLLDTLLGEIGIVRSEIYIANVLKCRPPGNRDPRTEEIDSCKGYLREQIRLIAPEVVMTLGNFATKLLLNTEVGISRLRGKPHDWWLGATLVPTFHPAAALRSGDKVTNQMREDFLVVDGIMADRAASHETAGAAEGPAQMNLLG
jgi:uracil-DNA glycosylase